MMQAVNDIDTIARLTEDLHQQHFINEPDYYIKLHHQAAIAAMSAFVIRGCKPEDVAELSWELAGAMIDKLKNEK